MFRSIKNKLIFLFLIAVLTPLLVMRLIAYPTAQKAIQETTIKNLQLVGSEKVSRVNDWVNRLKNNAEIIASNPLVATATTLEKTDMKTISQVISHIPCESGFCKFMISDLSGDIKIATDDKLIGLNISDIEGFGHVVQGKTYISDIMSSVFYEPDEFGNRADGLPSLNVFAPIRNEDGHVVGVMMFQAGLSDLNKEMQEIQYDSYIINQHGLMITESRFVNQLKNTGLIKERTALGLAVVEPKTKQFTKSVISCLNGGNGFDVNGYINYAGEKVLGVWFWMPEFKWGVITEISASEVSLAVNNLKNPISKIFFYLTIAGVVLAFAGIAFAFVIGHRRLPILS